MTGQQRFVVVIFSVVVAALAGVFCFLSWERANQVAGIVSALVSIGSLGAALWASLATVSGTRVYVSRTGSATARAGGSANSGAITPSSGAAADTIRVDRTGDAESEGGQANSGFSAP
ncbi:hypothetical protein [Streptomyces cyaneofuscatus]|uniref:hypothetical protein n=1 Tax=Streptomyces cyaneofuscatus TaxID=66883 RepID=UPI003819ABCE